MSMRMCVGIHLHMAQVNECLWKPEEGIRSPGTGFTDSCKGNRCSSPLSQLSSAPVFL